ncbi:MAG: PQQ-like beta-propeller repeat protein [Phycisphaerae bacterium]|jgi:outer membrane protein assembly factor BamB|nr:PQQ-like beta-propeller repeat protein [Phycisphaerae bacterium]
MSLKLTYITACVGLVLICTSTFRAAEPTNAKPAPQWFQWRGPNRDGKSPDTGLLTNWPEGGPKQLWKLSGIGQGFSSVSFGGGLIYVTGRKEKGNPSKLPEAPHVYKRPGERYYIFAIDMKGKVKWVRDMTKAYLGYYKGTRGTVTYDNGLIYVETGTGEILCCDAQTGKTKWKLDIHKKFKGITPEGHTFGRSESVLIIGDLLIATPGGEDAFMVALDKKTGKTVWKSPKISAAAHTSPIYVVYKGVPVIINGAHVGLVCVHARTGKIQWVQKFAEGARGRVSTPCFVDGYVYWAVGYGKGGICMKMSVSGKKVKAKEAWRTEDMDCIVGGHIVQDGYIYGNNKNGYACIELKTGRTMWTTDGEKVGGKGSVCWADGMLYLYAEKDGKACLATCSPKGLEIKGTVSVAGTNQSWAHPVVFDGRLYLRYDDNLYCFDVKAK